MKGKESESAERGRKKEAGKEGRKGEKSRREKKEERERRGGEEIREETEKEGREGGCHSSQRPHGEPLLPSTAFQCKRCHPICDRVNWFFDVSRKVLIEKKKNTNLPFSTDSCLSILKKKKILLIPKGFLLSPPKSPLPLSNSHHLAVILDHGFFSGSR